MYYLYFPPNLLKSRQQWKQGLSDKQIFVILHVLAMKERKLLQQAAGMLFDFTWI